jgi:uncharacterized protein YkwD
MAMQEKLEHELDDKTPGDRVEATGYDPRTVGENIACKQPAPKDVLATWMKSPPHRGNILKEEFTEIGVAAVKNKKGELYWVQVFGSPRE